MQLKVLLIKLMTSEEFYTVEMTDIDLDLYSEHMDLFSVVNPKILDSMLHAEFVSMKIR